MKRSIYLALATSFCVLGVSLYLSRSKHPEDPTIIATRSDDTNVADTRNLTLSAETTPQPKSAKKQSIGPAPLAAVDFMGNSVDLNGKTVGKYVSDLSSSAQAGDAESKFKIYRALTICARAPEQQSILNNLPSGTTDSNFISSLQSSIGFAKSVCGDASQIQISKDRLENVRQAADLGIVDAQIAFFFEGPNGNMHDFSVPDDNLNISEWKRSALEYLVKAGKSGNQLALSALSKAYEDGEVVPKDLKAALAYAVADSNKRNLDPGSQTTVNSLARQLTPDEVRGAIATGNAIVAPSRN